MIIKGISVLSPISVNTTATIPKAPIDKLTRGAVGVIRNVELSPADILRMREIGVGVGSRYTTLFHAPGGGVAIRDGQKAWAISHRATKNILVEQIGFDSNFTAEKTLQDLRRSSLNGLFSFMNKSWSKLKTVFAGPKPAVQNHSNR